MYVHNKDNHMLTLIAIAISIFLYIAFNGIFGERVVRIYQLVVVISITLTLIFF